MKFFAPFRISENISKTPEGFLLCKNVSIGRTGEMVYGVGEVPLQPGPDGKIIVSRTAEELFRPETISSFEGKSITVLHPEDFVDPENWNDVTNGIVQNVRRGIGEQENDLVSDFLITTQNAIDLVENGLREVSCGYESEYTQTGVGRGFQTNIFGNHVALVEEGRAGSSYAINDHKGKGSSMKVSEKIKAIFAKAQDEAMDAAGCKDEMVKGLSADDMKGIMDKYLDEKFAQMSGKKDDAKDAEPEKKPEEKAKDAEEPSSMEDRLKKLEDMVAKLVQSGDDKADGDEEESQDDAQEEEEGSETGDSAFEEDEEDTAARVEILAPGMNSEGKNVKGKALLAAYATKDGKLAIDKITGGKAPNVKDEQICNALFIGASEVLKSVRSNELSQARTSARDSALKTVVSKGTKTPEEINEINAKHWAKKS